MKFYRYFYNIKEPFAKITDINSSNVQEYLKFIDEKSLARKTYNTNYINKRLETEKKIRNRFIEKGGKPILEHPHYLVLENCDYWFFKEKNAFASLVIESAKFSKDIVSFTYGDSIPTFDNEFDDGKEYRKEVYTIDEIEGIINKYSLPQLWNYNSQYGPENYIEVQIWDDKVISDYNIRKTKDIFKSLDLLFLSILDGNKRLKTILNSYPNQISLNELFSNSEFKIIQELYYKFQTIYMKDKMHGIEHALRTAIYMFLIGKIADVEKEFLKVMLITAFAHDIGRKYSNNEEHGLISAKILHLVMPEQTSYIDIMKKAITAHSINNYKLYLEINSSNEKEKNLLLWLKDADTLDYIRFGIGEYNLNLLKTKEAKKLVKIAAQLNMYMFIYPDDDFSFFKER